MFKVPDKLKRAGLICLAVGIVQATAICLSDTTSDPVSQEKQPVLEPETLNYVWVPKGSLQVHLDFYHNRGDRETSQVSLPQAWLRYGLTPKLQAVFKPPSYSRFGGRDAIRQGWESLYTGVQYQLDKKPGGIDTAIEGGVWIPPRDVGMDFKNLTPQLKFYYQQSLPKKCWLYTEIPILLVETSPRAKYQLEPFAIAGHVIHPKASIFLSYKGFWFENIHNSHEFGTGISYNASKTTQVNVYTGLGIGPNSPKFFVGTFISMRVDTLAKHWAQQSIP